jgi:mRNA interferase MazF
MAAQTEKISISLPKILSCFIEQYQKVHEHKTRSEIIQEALGLLQERELEAHYLAASTITVLPITSNVSKVYPFEVYLEEKDSGLSKKSKIQCHQIRTISKLRISSQLLGHVKDAILKQIEHGLKLHLDFK